MKKVIFILFVILGSCMEQANTEVKEKVYTIAPDMNHWSKDTLGNRTESPLFGYYGDKNLIVDEQGKLFYYSYSQNYNTDCIYDNTIPKQKLIHLNPKDFIELNDNTIEGFIDQNINDADIPKGQFITLVIGTARDTFNSATLTKALSKLEYEKVVYMIRPLTEEEKVVLAYYKSGEPYYPAKVIWDTTKVVLNR
ncbi:hypothetical protein GN157_09330 [Flavobacterium rakeshii]|uniref:Lipoprotein n=1 Tax=Flavobacterium rakeshii TaxID=1038845 RepID=A0A6N8HEQ7_9FLAO|nr:hypothetical protein [Flavobacterium rakeshii]MUV03907.1 hypothetical protein [Flavobacterium rakeshii]